MTNLPKRLQQLQCSFGNHEYKTVNSIGYESWSEYTLKCRFCGEMVKRGYNKGIPEKDILIRKGNY